MRSTPLKDTILICYYEKLFHSHFSLMRYSFPQEEMRVNNKCQNIELNKNYMNIKKNKFNILNKFNCEIRKLLLSR